MIRAIFEDTIELIALAAFVAAIFFLGIGFGG